MITSQMSRLLRSWFLALVLVATLAALPDPVIAADSAVAYRPSQAVLHAAWYDEILNSRSRTIQIVFILVLVGAFMLRRSS